MQSVCVNGSLELWSFLYLKFELFSWVVKKIGIAKKYPLGISLMSLYWLQSWVLQHSLERYSNWVSYNIIVGISTNSKYAFDGVGQYHITWNSCKHLESWL